LFREKLVNVSGIVDLAYDWLDERLYYVLHTPQGYTIKRRKVKHLLDYQDLLTEKEPITSLWLHSNYQFMYYTMADGSVKRCLLEGKACKVIYTALDGGGYKVHAVTSDPRTKTLYLATSSSVIKTDLEGKDPVTHITYGDGQPSQPAVAVIGDTFYWVAADKHGDVVTRAIRSADIEGSTKRKKLYHARLEYASTGQYEKVKKIAIMDPALCVFDPETLASTSSKTSLVAGVISGIAIIVILVAIVIFVRLKRRGFTFLPYERLRRNDHVLMENMGDVTYDNPVYEFDPDDQLDNPSDRLVHLPPPLTTSGAENVEDYNMEVSLQGYENEYEVSDDEHDTSIFDNDKI